MPERIVAKKDIVKFLEGRQKLVRKRFTIRCRKKRKSKDLFVYRYPAKHLCVSRSDDTKKVIDTLDRCGMLDLRCEYYPSRLRPETGVKYDSILMNGFGQWFQNIVENKRDIFLDTNMIIYHTCSKALVNRIPNRKEFLIKLKIPRLVLLELEAIFNRVKKEYENCVKGIAKLEVKKGSEKKLSKIRESKERHERDMRRMSRRRPRLLNTAPHTTGRRI